MDVSRETEAASGDATSVSPPLRFGTYFSVQTVPAGSEQNYGRTIVEL